MSESPMRAAIRRMITVRWRLRIWGGIAALLALLLGLLPLFGVLGFELALAMALFASVMGLDVGCAFAKELQRAAPVGVERATWPGRTLARTTLGAAGVAVTIILIPVPICAIRGIWVPTCDWWFGLHSYVALPVLTAALAGAAGHAMGVIGGPRRWRAGALCVLVWLGVAIAAFWRFYSEPPVFTFNAILGYFPGNLYDEDVQLTRALAWSRLEQLLWLACLVALLAARFDVPSHRLRLRAPRPASGRQPALGVALATGALGTLLHLSSGTLGYAIDDEDMIEALGGRLETEHFVIYYSTRTNVLTDIALVARDHEYRFDQVIAQIGVAPAGKIRSFYFADRAQKKQLFGAKDVEMAKPWLGDIYLEHRSFPHPSLRHEIAHAVAAEFGDPIFHVAAGRLLGVPVFFNPALIEGLAVALDWPAGYDRPTAHESVRAMQAKGKAPRIAQLSNAVSFFQQSSQRGYTTAGSFLRFLLDEHGAPTVRALYESGGDFVGVFGRSAKELEREWHAHLATIAIPATLSDALEERFRAGSVFARPCPHAIAKKRERVVEALSEGDRAKAVKLMRSVCKDAPEERTYQIQLAELLASGDTAQADEARRIWTDVVADEEGVTSSLRARALAALARQAGMAGDLALAKQRIDEALKLPIEATDRRQFESIAFAVSHTGPGAKALQDYVFPSRTPETPDSLAVAEAIIAAEPTLGQGHYLVGLQRSFRRDWDGAATALTRALELGLPSPLFVKNAARVLAVTAYRSKDRAGVERAIEVLSRPAMTTGDQLLAADWARRLRFDARTAGP